MKSTIVGVAATIVACVVGIVYTEWRNTDPRISGEWIVLSPDFITLALSMIGSVAGFVLLCVGAVRLWPIAHKRFRPRRQRFAELAPELRHLQQMTLDSVSLRRRPPTFTDRTRANVLLERLGELGVHCRPPDHSGTPLNTWRSMERCFEVLAVLADAGKLDEAKHVAKEWRAHMRSDTAMFPGIRDC